MNSQGFRFSKNPVLFWYVSMPEFIWIVINGETRRIFHMFSIPELARTLFAPWKRDEFSTEHLALSDKLQVWAGNMATRFIAFCIRSITILIGLLALSGYFLLGMIMIGVVILLPLIIIGFLILGAK